MHFFVFSLRISFYFPLTILLMACLTSWTIPLTWSLISAINEHEEIKRGLFPPPGSTASTAKGGGKTKLDHQLALAKELFGYPESPHFESFSAAVGNRSEEKKWCHKIKNRLSKYVPFQLVDFSSNY